MGLKAGLHDAGEAAWNLRVLSRSKAPERFAGVTNSDLAFTGKYTVQGHYNGFDIFDIAKYGTSKGLRMCIATEFVLIGLDCIADAQRLQQLVQ